MDFIDCLRLPSLYFAFTFLYMTTILHKLLKGGLKPGPKCFWNLLLVVIGEMVCFFMLPGYVGLFLLCLEFLLSLTVLRKYEEFLPVSNKALLITGCDSGIGKALAKHFDKLGFTVFAGVLNEKGPGPDELRRSCSERLSLIRLDVTDTTQISQAYLQVKAYMADTVLWGVVNNAGVLGYVTDAEVLPVTVYQKNMAVNFFGAVQVSKTFLPLLRHSKGRLITISSMAGEVPIPGFSSYGASKAALVCFANVLRQELFKWGVKVINIQPSAFKTNILGTIDEWVNNRNQVLSSLSPEIKNDYGEEYFIASDDKWKKMMLDSPDNLKPVLNDVYHALMAKFPEHLYRPGKGAWLIPFIHTYFPVYINDFLIGMLFATNKYYPRALKNKYSNEP
ncbi:estradiol 17-beta-dehydrogenase 2 [Polypterus senegalus]|uniref:estradiol 17-beta-dehydrogenase 2 n=1 Tax=Polypterus senegalus TaxID=55291 RepID=UPI0019650003|nr:estradiol 17-beta-dehydrogenase 2 [Polypterus senegalus]